MEKLLRALERRFGRYAIQNVAILLVAPKVAFYFFAMSRGGEVGDVFAKVMLIPEKVMDGEVWRVASFIATTGESNPIFFLVYVMLTFLFCSALLQRWGAFRLNVYLLIGWVLTVLGSFGANALSPGYLHLPGFSQVELTLFLGFATFYPNYELRLFFILPVKVKWIAWLTIGYVILQFGEGPWDHRSGYAHRLMILCALSNYLLFFGPALVKSTAQKQQASSRRREFEEAMRRGHEERERAKREDEEERALRAKEANDEENDR